MDRRGTPTASSSSSHTIMYNKQLERATVFKCKIGEVLSVHFSAVVLSSIFSKLCSALRWRVDNFHHRPLDSVPVQCSANLRRCNYVPAIAEPWQRKRTYANQISRSYFCHPASSLQFHCARVLLVTMCSVLKGPNAKRTVCWLPPPHSHVGCCANWPNRTHNSQSVTPTTE